MAILYQLAGQIEMARGNFQTSWDFYMKALSEVGIINNVTLANSIKIDIFEWMIRKQDKLASQLQGELKNEIARMYIHDQQRFSKLVHEHYPSN